ncbi:MAG: tetratricopeptide repeat protein [Gemmataceae bacterium]|nr:tetratricopeptide repeat protein [Gemmataceae bacterium]
MRAFVVIAAGVCLSLPGCATTSPTVELARYYNDDGVYLFSQGHYRQALECFELALTLEPDNHGMLYNAGQCHDRLGHWQTAERYYLEVLQRHANHADARRAYVALLYQTGRAEEANRLIDQWLQQQPNSPDAYVLDAWRLRRQKAFPQALGRLQQALAVDPHHAPALIEMAILYEQTGMPERAAALYERIVDRQPDQAEVKRRLDELRSRGIARPLPSE